MMIDLTHIVAFGIELKRLEEGDLPLLCYWRNQPDLLQYLEDTRAVDVRGLQFWFNKICNDNSTFPYIVYQNTHAVAYAEIKNINWQTKECESGIFLFGDEHSGTGLAEKIALCWEVIVSNLNLSSYTSKIHVNNRRCIRFIEKVGGEYAGTTGNVLALKHSFEKRRTVLQALARKHNVEKEFLALL